MSSESTTPLDQRGGSALPARPQPVLPAGFDWVTFIGLALGLVLLYGPAYVELAHTIWATDAQGHGPIIFIVSIWLLYGKRHEIAALNSRGSPFFGWSLLLVGLLLYAIGESQDIIMATISSQIVILCSLMLIFKGVQGLRLIWFALFFMIFMVPFPEALVATVTGPLKSAVSAAAGNLLYNLGYPVGRSGVVITVGAYQLLVADACAGLNSMFTLEALGMLYMNLMAYTNVARHAAVVIVLIQISFCANVVRVMILILVTYHFGDAAGQGFVHGFAGMVLFMVALVFMLLTDRLFGVFMPPHSARVSE